MGGRARSARLLGLGLILGCLVLGAHGHAAAAEPQALLPTVGAEGLEPARRPEQVATVLQVVALLTVLTLSPSILIMTTCFTRIVIVFGFLRRALATQQLPPNPVIMGMALLLTFFIMYPSWEQAWHDGLGPYLRGELVNGQPMTQEEAFDRTLAPVRHFMFRCLEDNRGRAEIETFLTIAGRQVGPDEVITRETVPTHVLVPAFVTAELKRAFWMGFLLYLPFLVVDMVISSVLMSMGMMMLPPVMISLPFKVILFVLVDGWDLLVRGLAVSFPMFGS